MDVDTADSSEFWVHIGLLFTNELLYKSNIENF